MANTRNYESIRTYEKIVEAKELLQEFKEEREEECGIDTTELLQDSSVDTAAMAAVLMTSSFSYQSGWCIPSTRQALRFYDEAERRVSQGLGIPVRYNSYDQLLGPYEKIFFIYEDGEIIEVADKKCQQLGAQAFDYAWVEGEWTHQDVLPLIQNLEKVLAVM